MLLRTKLLASFAKAVIEEAALNLQEVEPELKRQKYTKLGSGAFSTVWLAPDKSYVLKVVDKQDKRYKAFIDYCIRNPSPHLPVILDQAISNKPHCWMLKMEAMKPVPLNVMWGIYFETLKAYYDYPSKKYDSWVRGDSIEEIKRNGGIEAAKKLPEDFLKVLYKVVKVGRSRSFGIDLPWTNIMQNPDGKLVIMDPWIGTDISPLRIYSMRLKGGGLS